MAELCLPDLLMDVPEVLASSQALSSEVSLCKDLLKEDDEKSTQSELLDEGEACWDALGRMNSVRRSNRFTKPKFVCVNVKRQSFGFGLELTGRSPPTIASMSTNVCQGIQVGDQVLEVNDCCVRSLSHLQAGHKISQTDGDSVKLLLKTVQPSSRALGQIVYSGWLMKRGGSGLIPKNWRRRWFILKDDCIVYYYTSSAETMPLGAIVLNNYTVSKASHDIKKPHAIQLVKGGQRTYYLSAENQEQMERWAQVLTEAASLERKAGNFSAPAHNVGMSALSIKSPDCSGFLHKRGGTIKTWKRRYCVLKGQQVFYYPSMTDTTASGVINLRGYIVERGRTNKSGKYYFSAVAPGPKMRDYCFYADSEGERERWLRAFQGETTFI